MMAADGSAATMAEGAVSARGPSYRWVYVWQWPIRAMHWLAMASILVLIATGFYVGRPYFMTGGEASAHYLMGTMRFLHFAAAGLLIATGIVRIYWLFAGNKYERLPALFPVKPKDWKNLVLQVKHYLMLRHAEAPHYLGHNPLQQLSYTGVYLIVILQVITGFALYGLYNPGGFFYEAFAWVGPLLGGAQVVRFVHHIITWVFLIFIPIHVYLGIRADVTEREGAISSIINGGRFVRDDFEYEDE
jgi:Ni/Fe-hydrogenase b-type cytochrome subunit